MKKELIRFACIAVLIMLFAMFVYPTPYKYFHHERYIIKINWITDKMWFGGTTTKWELIE